MKNIILIDGHNLLFRMFYGIPSPIRNSKGKDIRGLIGFVGSLKKIVEEFKPYSLFVIFDSETSKNNNLEIDNEYKANRIDYNNVVEEDNPFTQLPLIKKALDYLNIAHLEVIENEADDLIASITSKDSCNEYIIVSTDSDFIQLINDNVSLYVPRGKKSILYNKEEVIKKYNITPDKYVIFKSLIGDKSDNIKGIKGIGGIIAAKILNYSSIQEFVLNNPNSRISNILNNNEELIIKNQKLINLNINLDISKIVFNKLDNTIYAAKTYEIIEAIGER